MATFNASSYPIVFKIIDGYLLASSLEFGITISKRFSEVRQADEIGSLFLEVLKRIEKEIAKRHALQEPVPEPRKLKELIPSDDPPVMTIREVARLLRVSADTVRRLSDSGRLTSFNTPGGHRRFRLSHVKAFLEI
jgi:excisionase family DNA binding protein